MIPTTPQRRDSHNDAYRPRWQQHGGDRDDVCLPQWLSSDDHDRNIATTLAYNEGSRVMITTKPALYDDSGKTFTAMPGCHDNRPFLLITCGHTFPSSARTLPFSTLPWRRTSLTATTACQPKAWKKLSSVRPPRTHDDECVGIRRF